MLRKLGLMLITCFVLLSITACSKKEEAKVSEDKVPETKSVKPKKLTELSDPIQLPEAGKTELNYMSAADFNGDNVTDLVVGNFSGELAVKINSGTDKNPNFKAKENLKVNGEVLKIPHW